MALIYASAVNKRIGNNGLSKHNRGIGHSHGSKSDKKCSLQLHDFSSETFGNSQVSFLINSKGNKRSVEELIIIPKSKSRECIRSISVCREHPFAKNDRFGYQKIGESVSASSSSRNCSAESRDDLRCCRKHSKNKNNKYFTGGSKKSFYNEQTKTSINKISNRKVSVPPISSYKIIKIDDDNQYDKDFLRSKSEKKQLITSKEGINECLCQSVIKQNPTKSVSVSHTTERTLSHVIELNGRRKSLSCDNICTLLENNNNESIDVTEKNEISAFQKMKNRFKKWKL
ncbi:Hypothetical protein SRAE_X000251700 [Strongyloides ratti]|uniref:Uncharacterized protein n=1 Tax=Strongyloides ratti TaxID=34506 RepID=A0A090KZW5_STRRB|nr:Hypothetical protein SRAE_X000251700 [Strongyloides ratti]CEF60734.1 Hypothetical protein SRAE_X000251700 [Strongyloides ratti]